jgi:hypothetical protein
MSKLSEKELLLLCNYMYIDGSTDIDDVLKYSIPKIESKVLSDKKGKCLSGSIERKEALGIILQIKSNNNLMCLEPVASIDTGVRATCFVNPADNEAVLVFRGTGGKHGEII